MDENIKNAIAHFDKKVTDYQIHVERELQTLNEKIKTQEKYMLNTVGQLTELLGGI